MSRLPRITGKQLIVALKSIGFVVIRIKGSHHFLEHPDKRCTVVPVHSGEIIGPGLMNKILNDSEVTKQELADLL